MRTTYERAHGSPRLGARVVRVVHRRLRVRMDSMFDVTLLGSESVRPLKRSEFETLIKQGVFEDEDVELLHGFLVQMSPQGDEHSMSIARLN